MEIIHPEDRVQNSDAFRSLQSGAVSSFEMESRYLHKNRSVVLVREFVSALPDSADTKANFMALVTDVSVQRKSLDALRQSEERIRTILRTASDAIITIDQGGIIQSFSRGLLRRAYSTVHAGRVTDAAIAMRLARLGSRWMTNKTVVAPII